MTNSLLRWHLARDNQEKLHTFLAKHKVRSETKIVGVQPNGMDIFTNTYHLTNGAWVTVEMLQGTCISEYFQVTNYDWGDA